MNFRMSRRSALRGLCSLPLVTTVGCGAGSEDEGDAQDSEVNADATRELLSRYKKFVILVMENRSFDHLFGHLSLPTSEGGQGRKRGQGPKDVNGFESLAKHT